MVTHTELAETYKRLRATSKALNLSLMSLVPKGSLEAAGKKLGMWRQGKLAFGNVDESNVLFDYAIYEQHEDGENAVDRYLRLHPPPPGSEEQVILKAKQQAFYAILVAEEVLPGLGVRARDVLRQRSILLADISISTTPCKGLAIATRLIPFEGFVMTSGAPLPLEEKALLRLKKWAADGTLPVGPSAVAALNRQQRGDLAARITRLALETGGGEHIRYAAVPEPGKYVPTPKAEPVPAGVRPGRNDPCPCGSGRKYKKCCGPRWSR